ncbi:MAG: PQQ-dependent sugar dehydrogenase [Pseudomonadota bacterium]|nr:PQQ-dependent sugar dehydrogenase [Burkholderiales bacterium]MDQ3196684.1 PQQ-dependent sugar dehydrogenase [Pseudomonadota bacterium]
MSFGRLPYNNDGHTTVRKKPGAAVFLTFATLTSLIATSAFAQAPRSPTPKSVDAPVRTTVVAKGLEHPWGLAFLPDGRMLVTERPGLLRIVDKKGKLSEPLEGVPKVLARGQGGLLDVAVSPQFASDRLVYLSYSEPGNGGAGTAVARGTLAQDGGSLENLKVIWRQVPKVNSPNHWGSRLVFAPDGTLFVTTGDRFTHRDKVQDLSTTIGKVVRINADGSAPKDNPFSGREGARPEIWSYGHRNAQAAALHPQTGQLWTIEHGARGGDELNHPEAGKNYGWPVITYGIDYSGQKIGEGAGKAGMEQPVYWWDPVIAPSGAVFYTGDAFPNWKGDLFIGSLKPGALVRLDLENGRVAGEERYLGKLGERIRDVRQGPDGLLYLLTDSDDGQVLRVEPAAAGR